MTIGIWDAITLIISVIAFTYAFVAERNRTNSGDRYSIKHLMDEIAILKEKIQDKEIRIAELLNNIISLKEDRDIALHDKDLKINELTLRIDSLRRRITHLEILLFTSGNKKYMEEQFYDLTDQVTPKVLLVSSNPRMQKIDENSLQRARVAYRRLINATKDILEDELRRRRQDETMFKYIIFSAHMDERGIQLFDGSILDSYWLAQNVADVTLIILNGCESIEIADKLIGVVDTVISMREEILDDQAGSFLVVFWRRMVAGDTIQQAYAAALRAEPSIIPFVDIQGAYLDERS